MGSIERGISSLGKPSETSHTNPAGAGLPQVDKQNRRRFLAILAGGFASLVLSQQTAGADDGDIIEVSGIQAGGEPPVQPDDNPELTGQGGGGAPSPDAGAAGINTNPESPLPYYETPGGWFRVEDFPGAERRFRPSSEIALALDQALANVNQRVSLIPDETLTKEMVKPGITKDGAIYLSSCLDVSPFDARFSQLGCYDQDWFLLKPVYTTPGKVELRYRLLNPSRKPSNIVWEKLMWNFNHGYIPMYVAMATDPDPNSNFNRSLSDKIGNLEALQVLPTPSLPTN